MSDELTGAQRKHLRGLAHSLDPVVRIGQHGVTEPVLEEIDHALEAHELIKVKIAGDRDERREAAERIARESDAVLVGTIGTIAILYRRHPDPEERRVDL